VNGTKPLLVDGIFEAKIHLTDYENSLKQRIKILAKRAVLKFFGSKILPELPPFH
jgi:hypothetical protein